MKKLIDYLEENAKRFPDKKAYFDDTESLTWEELLSLAFRTGIYVKRRTKENCPVGILLKKSPKAVASFLGVALAGRPYVCIDENLPTGRKEKMYSSLSFSFFIEESSFEKIRMEKISGKDEKEFRDEAKKRSEKMPLYITFTSSSTGEPKAVLTSYASVYHYVSELVKTLGFHENSVMANQAPFYFDAYLKDVYTALFTGGSVLLIKKEWFLNPTELLERLKNADVNTLTWSASAYTLLYRAGLQFEETFAKRMKLLTFGSEVMRSGVCNWLRNNFPNARLFQLYGTTETTGMTAYFEIEKEYADDEKIPLGRAFEGMKLALHEGEIIISGKALSEGYINNPEKTQEVFRILNGERTYFTGDLGEYGKNGEIFFLTRRHRVIKRAGYMLSLDELEKMVEKIPKVKEAAALFDEEAEKIILSYAGEVDRTLIRSFLLEKLPGNILPSKIVKKEKLPRLENGKVDYRGLKNGKNYRTADGNQ